MLIPNSANGGHVLLGSNRNSTEMDYPVKAKAIQALHPKILTLLNFLSSSFLPSFLDQDFCLIQDLTDY